LVDLRVDVCGDGASFRIPAAFWGLEHTGTEEGKDKGARRGDSITVCLMGTGLAGGLRVGYVLTLPSAFDAIADADGLLVPVFLAVAFPDAGVGEVLEVRHIGKR
jgi:hypothetical protein